MNGPLLIFSQGFEIYRIDTKNYNALVFVMNQSEVVGSLLLRFSDLEEVDVQNLDFHAGKFQLNSASRISPFSIWKGMKIFNNTFS